MKSILRIILKFVDLKGLLKELVDVKLEAEIDRIVAKTDNVLDDSMKAMLYPILEKEALEAIEKLDFEKLLGLSEAEA